MLVVVLDVVADQPFELSVVPDDGPVEELSADRSDPALGEGVGDRGPDGCAEDLEAFGPEDLVERVYELAPAIANQCPSTVELGAVAQEEVAGCLGGPGARRVCGG